MRTLNKGSQIVVTLNNGEPYEIIIILNRRELLTIHSRIFEVPAFGVMDFALNCRSKIAHRMYEPMLK